MQFNGNFIGYRCPNTSMSFLSGDDKDRFHRNLKTQPNDWYYRHNEVRYDINSLGHRSKNTNNIDLDNYILFAGCSHVEGSGLELEKTFPYITANVLNMDYYNLGLSGTGTDIMTYNLLMWAQIMKKMPKVLVIMPPQPARFVRMDTDNSLINEVPSCMTNPECEEFAVIGENIKFFDAVVKMSNNLLDTMYPCKTIKIDSDLFGQEDKARDLSHAGIESNLKMAQYLISLINE